MTGVHDIPLLILAALTLGLTPGPDMFYILGRSVAQGRRAGVMSVLGITSGAALHVLAAAFGLSAFLATSADAFTVVRLAGAAYLVYLGGRTLLGRRRLPEGPEVETSGPGGWALFRQGFLTDLLNPKVALFFLAFLPQFISPDRPDRVGAFLYLGGIVLAFGLLCDLGVAVLSTALTRMLRANRRASAVLDKVLGSMLIALGLNLARESQG